jgi:sugar phosphate isomerase/epimerase
MPHSLPTVNWVAFEDDGGLRPVASLREVITAIADAGSGGIGLDDVSVGLDGVDEAVSLLHASGLLCTDVGVLRVGAPGTSAIASTEWLARLAEPTGARICIAALYASPKEESVVRELERAAEIVAAAGVRLALEFAPYSQLDSLAATVALCERAGWDRCGVLLDTWHFCLSGAPWAELRALRPEQIALVHLSDAPEPESDDLRHESRFRRVAPGAGTLPLGEVVETLREIGYTGVVSAEVLSAELRAAPPSEGARVLAESLRAIWPE